jgi:hypothetical protein
MMEKRNRIKMLGNGIAVMVCAIVLSLGFGGNVHAADLVLGTMPGTAYKTDEPITTPGYIGVLAELLDETTGQIKAVGAISSGQTIAGTEWKGMDGAKYTLDNSNIYVCMDTEINTSSGDPLLVAALVPIYNPDYDKTVAAAKSAQASAAASSGSTTIKMKNGDVFDAAYYAQANPDVTAALGTSPKALYRHYLKYGKKEGRKPNANAK